MKNVTIQWWQGLFSTLFLLIFLSPASYSHPVHSGPQATCPSPNVSVTQQSGGFSFSWDAVGGASGYKVWYRRHEDNYTSSPVSTGSTSISFTTLPAGTYDFYFQTVCGTDSSPYIVVDDLII